MYYGGIPIWNFIKDTLDRRLNRRWVCIRHDINTLFKPTQCLQKSKALVSIYVIETGNNNEDILEPFGCSHFAKLLLIILRLGICI